MDAILIVVVVVVATGIVLALVVIVLLARRWLVPTGQATVRVNEQRELTVPLGARLLEALADNGILLPSACGGRGSCGQCRVRVTTGGGPMLPVEHAHFTRQQVAEGGRLACMVSVRRDLAIRVPETQLAARRWTCTVQSVRCVAIYLREVVLAVPVESPVEFQAGDYVLIEAPPGQSPFASFDLPPGIRAEWQRRGLLQLVAQRDATEVRAYSLANPPLEGGVLTLVVRIATPPANAQPGTPPGKVSSYLFGLRAGDTVTVSGPFGDFHARDDDAEMVLIGGGAGIAPLRAIVRDQLLGRHTRRRISFWYGARSAADICYHEEFAALAAQFANFTFQVALSEVQSGSGWTGPTGFIHAVAHDEYLAEHPAPEEAEYYFCGPPLMSSAVLAMLEDLGVPRERIHFDDFGS